MSNVKGKIRKLLSIAKDRAASEHEIESCLRKAERLMYEHRLSEADLSDSFEDLDEDARNELCAKRSIYLRSRCYRWENELAAFIQSFIGGINYCFDRGESPDALPDEDGNTNDVSIMIYYGLADDVELAVEMFVSLHRLIKDLAVARHNSCFRGSGASFAEGYVLAQGRQLDTERLERKRIAEDANDGGESLRQYNQMLETVRSKEKIADDWLASPAGGAVQLGGPPRILKGSMASSIAFLSGLIAGEKHKVSDPRIAKLGHIQ